MIQHVRPLDYPQSLSMLNEGVRPSGLDRGRADEEGVGLRLVQLVPRMLTNLVYCDTLAGVSDEYS